MTSALPRHTSRPNRSRYDVVIVGTGMGGATLAYALRDSGARVLMVERGGFLPQEPQNWESAAVFAQGRYKNAEQWYAPDATPFVPGTYYYVGGNTKLYGASLPRFRREDLQRTEHADGVSPQWPFGYDALEPYYARAEQIYRVHGGDDDPTLPRQAPFPFPAVRHEYPVDELAAALRRQGLTASTVPLGLDLREGGACLRCRTCDGFPCQVLAKSDADVCCARPALESPDVELVTHARARRVLTNAAGRRVRRVRHPPASSSA